MTPPTLLFPADPRGLDAPDPTFVPERDAARAAGFDCRHFDGEALARGDADRALRRLPRDGGAVLHRGWMMPPARYAILHAALVARGWTPLVSPAAYEQAHHLPRAYPLLGALTAPTAWIEGADLDAAHAAALSLGAGAVLVKDHVKSAKHRWEEACFIPDAADRGHFERVVRAFLDERGERFERGLVFRKVLPLRLLRRDHRGMPVHEEHRMFFWRGELLLPEYYPEVRDEAERFGPMLAAAARFESPFISVDVARLEDGGVCVVEVGDGGVSGLPATLDEGEFFRALWEAMERAL